MGKQADTQGETTFNPHDKDPNRRKVQISKSDELFVGKHKPKRLGAVTAGKHLTVFPIRERRKGIRNQVTIGEFVDTRSKAHEGSSLYGKWYKRRKGDSIKEAILVDSPSDF